MIPPDLDRLAGLRPFTPASAAALVADEERAHVLEAVWSSGAARRSRPRDHRLAVAVAGSCAVGAVAAALVLMLGAPGPSRPSGAYVLSAARRALETKHQGIVEFTTTAPGASRTVNWFDLANDDLRTDDYAGGRLQLRSYVVGTRQVNVDYTTRTWSSSPPGSVVIGGFGLTRKAIERDLDNGTFALVGRTTVDGARALLLTGGSGGEVERLWIDASTYLPLRQTLSSGHRVTSSITYSWHRATPELRAKLAVTIPPGFTKTTG